MLTLIEYNLVPLAVSLAFGFASGLWMFRARTEGDRRK